MSFLSNSYWFIRKSTLSGRASGGVFGAFLATSAPMSDNGGADFITKNIKKYSVAGKVAEERYLDEYFKSS